MDKSTKTKAEVMAEQLAVRNAARVNAASTALPLPQRQAPNVPLNPPRTIPGMVFGAQDVLRESKQKVAALEGQLAQYEGSLPVRLLDAKLIKASKWANRHESSFVDDEFLSLKAEIEASNGNIQPIKVRAIGGKSEEKGGGVGPSNPPPAVGDSIQEYELVFGHRRHRACLELGIPVLAMIDSDLSDRALFEQMDRENRERKNLTAWEQGCMYAKALDEALFPSAGKLAEAIGRDLGDIGKAVGLARLPVEVINAIGNTQALQFRWSKPLRDAIQADPDGVLAKAREIIAVGGERDPKTVYEDLIRAEGKGLDRPTPPPKLKIKSMGLGGGTQRA